MPGTRITHTYSASNESPSEGRLQWGFRSGDVSSHLWRWPSDAQWASPSYRPLGPYLSIPKQKLRRFNSRQKFKGSNLIFVTFCQIVVANSHCFTRRRLRSRLRGRRIFGKDARWTHCSLGRRLLGKLYNDLLGEEDNLPCESQVVMKRRKFLV